MKSKSSLTMTLFPVLLIVVSLWGCPKKTEISSAPAEQVADTSAANAARNAETANTGTSTAPEISDKTVTAREAGAVPGGLQPIYFAYDRADIREDARTAMKANAQWLKSNSHALIRIEGNCDERGTREYNQALGQRRAANARKFLIDMGISAKRVTLISFGKEKPVCTESNEQCLQKNRRDDLIVLKN